jgi:hypothetical protein
VTISASAASEPKTFERMQSSSSTRE